MSRDGSGESNKGAAATGTQDDRSRGRSRKRRPRHPDRDREGAEKQASAPGQEAAREPGKPGRSQRRRGRGRSRDATDNKKTGARPADPKHSPEPPPTVGSAPEPAQPIAAAPPRGTEAEPAPQERPRTRGRRDDQGRGQRQPRMRRSGQDPHREHAPKPTRWSQLPPAADGEELNKPSIHPVREPGPPVFLPVAPPDEQPLDDATAFDIAPWEADVLQGDGEGTLYNTVRVRSSRTNRSRDYDAGDVIYARGDTVAVEGDGAGHAIGTVVQTNRRQLVRGRLPRVVRHAQGQDTQAEPRGRRREREVFRIARHVANTLGLPIKIVRTQAEPNGRIVVMFASEERIDFRELFRRVSAAAQGRVELRQLGVRDAAKMLGGVAPCGLQLCCTSFLREFAPVSIKMAKEQGLVLNPNRVSGLCGRLLCCLTYEDALYRTQRKLLPKLGKRVITPSGPGKVRDVDVLSQHIRVVLDSGDIVTVEPSDITPMFPSQKGGQDGRAPEDPRPGPRCRRTDRPPAAHRDQNAADEQTQAPAPQGEAKDRDDPNR